MIAPDNTSPNPAGTTLDGWEIIMGPTRAELLDTGEQIQIDPQLAAEAGFRWPVFMTSAAWESTIAAGGHEDEEGNIILPPTQSITGRLWDVLNLARFTIKTKGDDQRNPAFDVRVWGADGTKRIRVRRLYLEAGPIDYDDPKPSITIMTHDDI